MTTLECASKVLGWQGGTIHQLKERFAVATLAEQDSICTALVSNLRDIADIENVQYFTSKRLENMQMNTIAELCTA